MFERAHHQLIHKLLGKLNSELLTRCECYFAGGTAVALMLSEFRESVDVDFLCSSHDGYRMLRDVVFSNDINGLLSEPVKLLRDVRADRYGIRTFVEIDGVPIKFEIVNEGRIQLRGEMNAALGVPTLCMEDLYAEKLLANADRYNDKSVLSRDIIDIAMMIDGWGNIPQVSWEKARGAYGVSVDKSFSKAVEMISDRNYLKSCLEKMHIDQGLAERIPAILSKSRGYLPDVTPTAGKWKP